MVKSHIPESNFWNWESRLGETERIFPWDVKPCSYPWVLAQFCIKR